MKVYGYVRVSTQEQKLEVQISEIEKYCNYRNHEIIKIFEDKSTGKNEDREGFKDLVKFLEGNHDEIDGVVVYKLDRVGRNLKNLINFIEYLSTNNIQFLSISDNIDTSTSAGKLFFHMVAAFAEYEVALINERIELGRQKAREKNVKFGRPKKRVLSNEIQKLKAEGIPIATIARIKRVSRATIYNALNEGR